MSTRHTLTATLILSLVVVVVFVFILNQRGDNSARESLFGSGENPAIASDLFAPEKSETRNLSHSESGATSTEGWATYTSDAYRFSLKHPPDLVSDIHDEGDGASSLVFENEDLSNGFQIFVTPYSENTITRARFEMDQPSGALNEPVGVSVDGAGGMMFYGKNDDIGDTIEVWFVRDGILYEVYTYKVLEPYLKGILGTWKFTQ